MTLFRMSMLFSLQKTTRSVGILRAAWVIRRGLRPWHVRYGNREISRLANSYVTCAALVRVGKVRSRSVEPRVGTKRNAGEQSTHRTQCRPRVTQALDRVRQVLPSSTQGKNRPP
jgi:hypothetical protein